MVNSLVKFGIFVTESSKDTTLNHYHYKYDSGREGDAPLIGIASRANSITFYIGSDFDQAAELLSKLGKHKMTGGCLYIKKLEDIDTGVLLKMIDNAISHTRKKYPE